ncbi:zinc-binding dehydrogenase [Taklimakanibacter lacteus]|uniref:zinc-binding dehydrogenase n=1 Tax=Taklimakanibacter lacteus TaxID=2268456 RepID=UPI000E660BC9
MVEVRRSTVVDAPIEEVWALLRDFNGHDTWHPAVTRSSIEDKAPADMIGAVRAFQLADGSHIREQLLALSDRERSFDYCILDAPVPLMGYVAHVRLLPVTDGEQTFWEWRSKFTAPGSREKALEKLVAEDIYEAGFRAIKQLLRGKSKPAASVPSASARTAPLPAKGEDSAQAIVMHAHGGPDVLQYQSIQVARPQSDEVRIRQRFIGVNYIDVYMRTGYFNLISPPGIPGMEAVGVIESVGSSVSGFRPGDRVAYACAPPGAYTNLRVMKADVLVHVPDFLSDEIAGASLLKGITASFLLHEVYRVKPGHVVLVHAAAGGVGLLLTQWAKALGATVIGTTSSEEKVNRIRQAGCDHAINYASTDFAQAVLDITGGAGVDVVYDAVGRDTFEGSLRALKTRGTLVSFGQASGDIGLYEIGKLANKSVTLSRPNYGHYTETRAAILMHAQRFFSMVEKGAVSIGYPRVFRLAEAAAAHQALAERNTIGSIVLSAE